MWTSFGGANRRRYSKLYKGSVKVGLAEARQVHGLALVLDYSRCSIEQTLDSTGLVRAMVFGHVLPCDESRRHE